MRRRQHTTSRWKLLLLGTLLAARVAGARSHDQQQQPQRHVDLVIALDVSSSMDGLIDAARQKLWDVVSMLGSARPQPILRVGLISYGNSGYARDAGWVRRDLDLTSDLDTVYSKLFALRTGGGDEYVARAVRDATRDMAWDQDPQALKIIFVAGNEPATQDPEIKLETALGGARQKNIFVNAIYCGSPGAMEAAGWRDVARLGQGQYAAIDHNQSVVAQATPMDAELSRLGQALNRTYVGYGARRQAAAANQQAQDKNAESSSGEAAATRARAKASGLYRNDDWDLVDARAHGKKDVKTMGADELGGELATLKPAEREAYLDGKAKERAALQKQIAELSQKREAYLKAQKPAKAAHAFDDAFSGAVKEEAKKSGFAF